jgi:hypothetical protein
MFGWSVCHAIKFSTNKRLETTSIRFCQKLSSLVFPSSSSILEVQLHMLAASNFEKWFWLGARLWLLVALFGDKPQAIVNYGSIFIIQQVLN